MKILHKVVEFDWDDRNSQKNWIAHRVLISECEEVFFDEQNIATPDRTHSQSEVRIILLGKTKKGRKLHISFTHREDKIRIISARDQSKKERNIYEKKF